MAFTSKLGTSESTLGEFQQLAGATVVAGAISRNATNTFGFANTVEQAGPEFFYGLTNTIFATDPTATLDDVTIIFVSQQIFSQSIEELYYVASNSIFADANSSFANPDAYVEVVQYMGFTDRIFADDTGNYFGFTGTATVSVVADAANFFFTDPSGDNRVIQAHNAGNSIGYTGVVIALAERFAENTFALVASVSFSGPQNRSFDSGFIRQTVSFVVDDNAAREQKYDPIIGDSEDESFAEFNLRPPTFDAGTLVLTYPFDSPSSTLTLENPNFGEDDTLHFTRIDRKTRGGVRKIFSDPKWASFERLTMSVTGICEETRDTIIAFLNTSLGKEIGLADWEGRKWKGFIVAPETDITENREGFGLRLTFEGTQTLLTVQHGLDDVIHGQDDDGLEIEVVYEDD